MLFCRPVSSHLTAESAHARLQEELVQEGASALRRIGGRLEELIRELARHREAAGRSREAGPEDRRQAARDFARVRAEAVRYRWYLEVQREALGLRSHRVLDEIYPVPPVLDP